MHSLLDLIAAKDKWERITFFSHFICFRLKNCADMQGADGKIQ